MRKTLGQLHLSFGNAKRGVVGNLKHFCRKCLRRQRRKLAGYWGEKEVGITGTHPPPPIGIDTTPPFPLYMYVYICIIYISQSEGGVGLWMPEVYLWTTHAVTFTRYLQQPSRYGPEAYVAFSGWLEQKGIVHTPSQLALLQLSPCCICNAPWLASSVKALSSLNAT